MRRDHVFKLAATGAALAMLMAPVPAQGGTAAGGPICEPLFSTLGGAPAIEAGRAVQIYWRAALSPDCAGYNAVLMLNGQVVAHDGRLVEHLWFDKVYSLSLKDSQGTKILRQWKVKVYKRQSDLLTKLTGDGQLRVSRIRAGRMGEEELPAVATPGLDLLAVADVSRDGSDDLVWFAPQSNTVLAWLMHDGLRTGEKTLGTVLAGMRFQGVADVNNNGFADILWRNAAGEMRYWVNSVGPDLAVDLVTGGGNNPGPDWQVHGTGDFNGDGSGDILWRHTNGQVAIHYLDGPLRIGEEYPGGQDPSLIWTIEQVADFDADGFDDILWRHADGGLAIWLKGSDQLATYPTYNNVPNNHAGLGWKVVGAADFNFDGKSDILWRHQGGMVAIWMMNGGQWLQDTTVSPLEKRWEFFAIARSVA